MIPSRNPSPLRESCCARPLIGDPLASYLINHPYPAARSTNIHRPRLPDLQLRISYGGFESSQGNMLWLHSIYHSSQHSPIVPVAPLLSVHLGSYLLLLV